MEENGRGLRMPGCEPWELSPKAKEFCDNFDVRNIIIGATLIIVFMIGFAMGGGV